MNNFITHMHMFFTSHTLSISNGLFSHLPDSYLQISVTFRVPCIPTVSVCFSFYFSLYFLLVLNNVSQSMWTYTLCVSGWMDVQVKLQVQIHSNFKYNLQYNISVLKMQGPNPKAAAELIRVDGVLDAIIRHLRKA